MLAAGLGAGLLAASGTGQTAGENLKHQKP